VYKFLSRIFHNTKEIIPSVRESHDALLKEFVGNYSDIMWHYRDLYPSDDRVRSMWNIFRKYSSEFTIWEYDSDMDFQSIVVNPFKDAGWHRNFILMIKDKHRKLWIEFPGMEELLSACDTIPETFGCLGLLHISRPEQLSSLPHTQKQIILDMTSRYLKFKEKERVKHYKIINE